ncbi:hypothetical protein GIB67_003132, partial [Kingdonia uniflora]
TKVNSIYSIQPIYINIFKIFVQNLFSTLPSHVPPPGARCHPLGCLASSDERHHPTHQQLFVISLLNHPPHPLNTPLA